MVMNVFVNDEQERSFLLDYSRSAGTRCRGVGGARMQQAKQEEGQGLAACDSDIICRKNTTNMQACSMHGTAMRNETKINNQQPESEG